MAHGASVLGYYTLSAHSIARESPPEDVIKNLKLPKYPFIPATLIGRLSVDRKYERQGLSEILLLDGLERSYRQSRQVATCAAGSMRRTPRLSFS
jgi:hypothetical protein